MDTVAFRQIISREGPFASVYLPSATDWALLRPKLAEAHIDAPSLAALDKAVSRSDEGDHVYVAADGRLLVDEPPNWAPPSPIARVSELPYLLPLTEQRSAAAAPSLYDEFVFQAGLSDGLAVDGLGACATALRDHNANLLVVAVDQVGDRRVWIGVTQFDYVSADASLRGQGIPIVSRRADEALPTAALAIGAEVVVTTDPRPLADGVGVLRQSTTEDWWQRG